VLTSIRLCPSVDKIILAVIVVETNILSLWYPTQSFTKWYHIVPFLTGLIKVESVQSCLATLTFTPVLVGMFLPLFNSTLSTAYNMTGRTTEWWMDNVMEGSIHGLFQDIFSSWCDLGRP
jgi:hypothetical protein